MKLSFSKLVSPFYWRLLIIGVVVVQVVFFASGCARNEADAALETDANGYLCQDCRTKFYTDRETFADFCPNCKSFKLSQVVGFSCPADNTITIAARGSGFTPCDTCRSSVSGLVIPKESDFKKWNAAKKQKSEVTKS